MPAVCEALPEAEIVMELGRYLVGEAGLYVSKVIDKKVSRGHTYLIVDGGLHHHLARRAQNQVDGRLVPSITARVQPPGYHHSTAHLFATIHATQIMNAEAQI